MSNISAKLLIETVGIVGLIASLVFVGIEIQQNSVVAQAQSEQATSELMTNIFLLPAQDPELAELLISVNLGRLSIEDLDSRQSANLYFFYMLALQAWETSFQAVQSGIVPEGILDRYDGTYLLNPYVLSRWSEFRPVLTEEFAIFVESRELFEL